MANEAWTVDIEARGDIRLVRVSGSWDNTTHAAIKERLDAAAAESGNRIVLDLENLTYVNSTGLLWLARCQRERDARGAFFGIAAFNRRITRALEMLGLDKKLRLFATVDEAVRAANPP